MKVGIACENWKVPTFEKSLKEAGFTDYTVNLGHKSKPIAAIVVETDQVARLHFLCARLQSEFFHKKIGEN